MKKLYAVIAVLIILPQFGLFSQVTVFPYSCSFETGPDNAVVVDNEPDWHGSTSWQYDDASTQSGTFCGRASISTSNDFGKLIYVSFDFSNQSGLQPSFWYLAFLQNIEIQVVGRVNYGDWIVLKDWFVPAIGNWTCVDHTQMSNLPVFDNQQFCHFGITARQAGGTTTLRIDDVVLMAGGAPSTASWLTTAASSNWHDAVNWDGGAVPDINTNVLIPAAAAFFPEVSADNAACAGLQLEPGARLSINASLQLSVGGDACLSSGPAAAASLLESGTMNVAGNASFQQYLQAYTGDEDGWHLISSPLNVFTVAGSDFEPAAADDLYRWDEASSQWINYKTGSFNFNKGEGYLIACANSGLKTFTGSFNHDDVSFLDLSSGAGNGWHLLGNPFPCALKWNDGNWNLNNVEGVAKIYNENAGNYLDVVANDIIPACQGFFVKVVSASNSLNIPAASRVHDATAFFKSDLPYSYFNLKVNSVEKGFFDVNHIAFIDGADEDYDPMYDGHKMFGNEQAPQMYMLSGDGETLSSNALPAADAGNINLYFEAGHAGSYELRIKDMQLQENMVIYLQDLFNDSTLELNCTASYCFYASPGDPSQRFRIHYLSASSLQEHSVVWIRQERGNIFIDHPREALMVKVYDLKGSCLYREKLLPGQNMIPMEFKNGIYLLRLNNQSCKIYINRGL